MHSTRPGSSRSRELLRRLANENGVTVFMSSHILTEVAHLADRIGIVHGGRLLEELDYDELRSRTRQHLDVGVSDPDRAVALLPRAPRDPRGRADPGGRSASL